MWRETTKQERNRILFYEELDDFLPEKILDFHVHLFDEGVVPAGEMFSCSGHPITHYDRKELERDLEETYPGRETYAVCFGFPEVRYNRKENNETLAQACDRRRFFPLRLFDPAMDDPATLLEDLVSHRFFGIKPYPNYVRKANINEVCIHEMLPAWVMEIINDKHLAVMLHIPRKGRLADPLNQQQIMELCERYPHARIILAHIGRAYFLKNVIGNLEVVKCYPNLYVDLAMLNHWEVLEYTFSQVPHEKILYGTDIPLALAPGKSVEINDQYTYVTPVPWELSISDDHQKLAFTSFLYEELRAVKKAVERLHLKQVFKQKLFFENGMWLLEEIRQFNHFDT